MTWFARFYLWATHRLYDEFAWAYDLASWLVSLGRWSSWRRLALDHVDGQRVLEVGFGTGELLLELGVRELEVVGLDLSPAMHRVTARKLNRKGVEIPRVCASTQRMPFADRWFDSIVCTFPAGYILEQATLQEIARLLCPPNPITGKRGGRFIVVGMVVRSDHWLWRWAMQFLFGDQEEAAVDGFKRLASGAGLRVQVLEQEGGGLQVPVVLTELQSVGDQTGTRSTAMQVEQMRA
jgi:ubiquinone/menaquinone biosynthesis C-methylase UbiE